MALKGRQKLNSHHSWGQQATPEWPVEPEWPVVREEKTNKSGRRPGAPGIERRQVAVEDAWHWPLKKLRLSLKNDQKGVQDGFPENRPKKTPPQPIFPLKADPKEGPKEEKKRQVRADGSGF